MRAATNAARPARRRDRHPAPPSLGRAPHRLAPASTDPERRQRWAGPLRHSRPGAAPQSLRIGSASAIANGTAAANAAVAAHAAPAPAGGSVLTPAAAQPGRTRSPARRPRRRRGGLPAAPLPAHPRGLPPREPKAAAGGPSIPFSRGMRAAPPSSGRTPPPPPLLSPHRGPHPAGSAAPRSGAPRPPQFSPSPVRLFRVFVPPLGPASPAARILSRARNNPQTPLPECVYPQAPPIDARHTSVCCFFP